jgi:hypothetical protein
VLKIEARDGDYGVNWEITYDLSETGHDGMDAYFDIDSDTGSIKLARLIDAEVMFYTIGKLSFDIEVTAMETVPANTDPALGKKIVAKIEVNIVDANVRVTSSC